jgi:hypothetical protein
MYLGFLESERKAIEALEALTHEVGLITRRSRVRIPPPLWMERSAKAGLSFSREPVSALAIVPILFQFIS